MATNMISASPIIIETEQFLFLMWKSWYAIAGDFEELLVPVCVIWIRKRDKVPRIVIVIHSLGFSTHIHNNN